jgi:predicted nucleic acid-binding protein
MHRGPRRSSAGSATVVNVVLDASVIVRAAVDEAPAAREWTKRLGFDVRGYAPDLVWVEVGSALYRYVSSGALARTKAHEILAYATRLPVETRSLRGLAAAALAIAIRRGFSVYDACYVVLADALDAPLVTADRRLAAAVDRVELIP